MADHDKKHHQGKSGHPIDSTELEESYGQPIPEPHTIKGTISNIGMLAGSGDIVPKRNISFDDSVDDNYKNQPKSHD